MPQKSFKKNQYKTGEDIQESLKSLAVIELRLDWQYTGAFIVKFSLNC